MPFGAENFTKRRLILPDAGGAALWSIGFIFDTVGDWQVDHIKADEANNGSGYGRMEVDRWVQLADLFYGLNRPKGLRERPE